MSVMMVEPANEKGRIDSTDQLLRKIPIAFADPNEENIRPNILPPLQRDKNEGELERNNSKKLGQSKLSDSNIDGNINRAYTSPDIELQNYDISAQNDSNAPEKSATQMSQLTGNMTTVYSRTQIERIQQNSDDDNRSHNEDVGGGKTADDNKQSQHNKNKESSISDIGADYMRVNGAIGSFKQLQKPTSMQSLPTSSKMSYTSEDAGVALVSGSDGKYGMDESKSDKSKKDEKPNAGYRLGKRKALYERRRKLSDYSLVFGMFGIILMIVETELTMAQVYSKHQVYSTVLKSLISVSTVILLGLIVAYHILEIQLFAVDNCVEDWRIAVSLKRVTQLIIEIVICAIHPIPGEFYFIWVTRKYDASEDLVAKVPIDILLSLPMLLRLYLICRVMLLHSRLFTDASSRSIGALNRINFDTKFVLKTLMTICPGTVMLVFMLSLWIITSWLLRACESYLDPVRHKNILDSMWMIAITFLSVGYGDIVPNTYCGRGIAIATGVMGAGVTALVVAVISRKLELSRAEKHVHNFMMDTQLQKRLKYAAANVLRETWLIYKYTKLARKIDATRVRSHQRKFLQAIHSLRKVKMDQRKLMEHQSTLVDMGKNVGMVGLDTVPSVYISIPHSQFRQTQLQIHEMVHEMHGNHNTVEKRVTKIEDSLAKLQTQLDNLPAMIADKVMTKKQESTILRAEPAIQQINEDITLPDRRKSEFNQLRKASPPRRRKATSSAPSTHRASKI